jgi:outer membrane protein assembly factor BamE (lipoprotein component of BamABCDE complex)
MSTVALVVVGCASNAGGYTKASEVEMRLKGMAKSEVANQLGSPTQAIKISDDM